MTTDFRMQAGVFLTAFDVKNICSHETVMVMVTNYAKLKSLDPTDVERPLTLGHEIEGSTRGFDIMKPKPHLRHLGIFRGHLSSL